MTGLKEEAKKKKVVRTQQQQQKKSIANIFVKLFRQKKEISVNVLNNT